MASIKIVKRKRGVAYQIAFMYHGARRYLSLGSVYTKNEVVEIAANVERIVNCSVAGRPIEPRVALWLDSIPEDLKKRLARVDLVERYNEPTLSQLYDAYFESALQDMAENTVISKRNTRRVFFERVNPDKLAVAFTKQDAQAFATSLADSFSEASRACHVKNLRAVFNWAVLHELLKDNPFNVVKRGSFQNKEREYYVTLDDYAKLLDACASQEQRALLALWRIGGLRRNEAFDVQWRDVDWHGGRLLVRSSKTASKGKDKRVIPLFPELRQELEKLWELTPEGGPLNVITIERRRAPYLIEQIVFRAGLNRWQRLIQNLRSSRAIDVEREYGALAESEWLGHTAKVARAHYLHVLDVDFERAAATKTTAKTTAQYSAIGRF